jgi:hypothetical protein
MNAPLIVRTPTPIIREGMAIWHFEDIRLIYDALYNIWYRQQMDTPEDSKAVAVSSRLVDVFLGYYGLNTDMLIAKI